MQLPFFNKNKVEKEFYLAFIIKQHKVRVILFESINKNLTILSTQEEESAQLISDLETEQLIGIGDKVISYAEHALPEGAQVTKTIFAVPYTWVAEGRIKRERLVVLKKLCESLALTPIGFIVSVEAIVAHLQKKQGAPVTSIFVELGEDTLHLFIVKLGNVIEYISSERGKNLAESIEGMLKEVKNVEVLPSQIVLFDAPDVKTHEQQLLSHEWPKSIPFLHLPQVISLEKGFEDEALVNGVASQMGFDVMPEGVSPEEIETEEKGRGVEGEPSVKEESTLPGPEEFGFVKEKDIAKQEGKESLEENEEEIEEPLQREEIENVTEPIIHYAQGHKASESEESVSHHEHEEHKPLHHPAHHPQVHHKSHESTDDTTEERSAKKESAVAAILSSTQSILVSTIKNGKHMIKKFPLRHRGLLLPLSVILVLIIGFSYLYYNVIEKAEIEIQLDKTVFSKSQSITFSSDNSPSFANNVLSLKTISEQVEGEETTDTSGKKDTGEKAKGEVTIYNKIDQKKTFSKGAVLVGPNSLEYVLSDDASVASTSAFSTSLSSTKVKVEAAKFGQEYNLPSGTNFTFKEFPSSSFFAKNDSAFSGGTKKSVQVVAKKDLDNLTTSITESVKEKAVSQAQSKVGSDEAIISDPLSISFEDKSFNKKEGDEAKEVKLSATLTFNFGAYKKTELEDYTKELSKSEVPSGYTVDSENSKIDIKDIKVEKDEKVSATLDISQTYVPSIDSKDVIEQAKGKGVGSIEQKLRAIKGVTNVTIQLKRKLPIFPSLLPFNPNNIEVIVNK